MQLYSKKVIPQVSFIVGCLQAQVVPQESFLPNNNKIFQTDWAGQGIRKHKNFDPHLLLSISCGGTCVFITLISDTRCIASFENNLISPPGGCLQP